ncbi:MAG: DUF1028 domain-containing protein [Anaerolineae bacterium]|nr:DUF1028 domain-containing protein [Anaerolineae bacterium]MDQ7035497.1 DUF1028 domain-containing protein [Anaerolineae bacterium]
MYVNTFSIVAYDPDEKAWGVAVASKFLAVAALVSWAKADVGAVATQSFINMRYGSDGLALLAEGQSASEALARLLKDDNDREKRQVALVDAQGRVAAHTGKECHDYAGHKLGTHFSIQGNILTGADVLDAMADTYRSSSGELADRLLATLRAGESAGGDKRGKQAAGILVVKPNGGYGGNNDRYLDLRVDDDDKPIKKLAQLLETHHLYFGSPKPEDQLVINEEIARELQNIMVSQGYLGGEVNGTWDEVAQQAFWVLVGNENLEERWSPDKNPKQIDRVALDYLRKRFG